MAELLGLWFLDLTVQICFAELWLLLPKSLFFRAEFGDSFADIHGELVLPARVGQLSAKGKKEQRMVNNSCPLIFFKIYICVSFLSFLKCEGAQNL